MQVAAESTLFLLLTIAILAPGCPIDNVSIDECLLIQTTGGRDALSLLALADLSSPDFCQLFFFNFNVQIFLFRLSFNTIFIPSFFSLLLL